MKNLINEIVDLLKDKLENVEINAEKVTKNNGIVLNGITIKSDTSRIAPVIYVDKWIDEGMPVEEIVDRVIQNYSKIMYDESLGFIFEVDDYEKVKSRLSLALINKEANKDLFKTVPYKRFKDLAVIIKIEYDTKDILERRSVKVTRQLLEMWNKSFDDAFIDAYSNFKADTTEITNICDVIRELGGIDISSDVMMYVLTNKTGLDGAIRILDEETLSNFANSLGTDLIVIPSSIHEAILIPVIGNVASQLQKTSEIVKEINNTEVLPEEILSDHAYLYKKDSGWE